jgi:NDP-sugar pyrophosphorylase family protein
VILAAGKGERMYPLTNEIPKALVFLAGRTLLELAVERYNQSGIDDIVIAVGWKGSMIEDFVTKSKIRACVVHVSDYEIGPLQTFLTAINTFDGDFLLSPVDALIDPASMVGIQKLHDEIGVYDSMILAVGSNKKSGTLVTLNEDHVLTSIGNVGTGSKNIARSSMLLIANTRIREHCESALGEGKRKVVQLLEQFIQNGRQIRCYNANHQLFDIDTLSDLLAANQHLLQQGGFREPESIFIPSGDRIEVGDVLTLKSNIVFGKGTSLQGPVLIGSNSQIGEDCKLGPNVTIDSKTTLSTGCEVRDAVIFGNSNLSPHDRVHRSVIYNSKRYDAEA